MNHQIRLSPIRLIGSEGNQLGIVSLEEAREIARRDALDLVEVDANARPIVCKVMDWGKTKYDLAKKEKVAKRHGKTLEIKQVKFRPGIDSHDFNTKLAHARRFLEDGRRTKVTIMFRRRDLRRPENGIRVLDRVAKMLADVARVESRPSKIENRDLTMVLLPQAGVGHAVKTGEPKDSNHPAAATGPARKSPDGHAAASVGESSSRRG
ncbi:MAG: translation initiation factor IF-3 [Acidobacteriota bacterium]